MTVLQVCLLMLACGKSDAVGSRGTRAGKQVGDRKQALCASICVYMLAYMHMLVYMHIWTDLCIYSSLYAFLFAYIRVEKAAARQHICLNASMGFLFFIHIC